MAKKKAIVFGGAGFIGSHISDKLINRGVDVVVFDNFSRGLISNLTNIRGKVKIVEGDIKNYGDVERIMSEGQFNYVFLESALWFSDCENEPYKGMINNFLGSLNVIELSCQFQVDKVLFASSASLYGNSKSLPFKEDNPLNDRSFYSTSKIAVERLLESYYKKYSMPYTILRYMNVYGPRQDYRRDFTGVVMKIIKYVFEGKTPQIYGDGSQTLDLTYVEDVAEANVLAAFCVSAIGTYNISTEKETTVKDLVNEIILSMKSDLVAEYLKVDNELVGRRFASYESAKNTFGYEPTVLLTEGLLKTIEWYRNINI